MLAFSSATGGQNSLSRFSGQYHGHSARPVVSSPVVVSVAVVDDEVDEEEEEDDDDVEDDEDDEDVPSLSLSPTSFIGPQASGARRSARATGEAESGRTGIGHRRGPAFRTRRAARRGYSAMAASARRV
jgi:hypothetical protein